MDQVIARAAAFRRKVRWSHALEYVAGAFVIGIFTAGAAIPETLDLPPVARVGAALIALGCVFVMTYLWLRGAPAEVPRDSATLACYRAELERRRELLATVLVWYLAPFWPGMLVFLVGIAMHRWHVPGAPGTFATVVAVVVLTNVAIALTNRWAAKKLGRELDALPLP